MGDRFSQLPWAELWHTQGEIPWSVLQAFADGVAAEPDLATELFATYERAREVSLDKTCYTDLYVPAIFALAAPKLDEDRRRMIGEFLVKKLAEAGRDDDDFMMEVLLRASGSMGPVIVPTVLDAIAAEPDPKGAWFHLWGLTALAASTRETAVRDRVAQACAELLERADRGEADPDDGIEAAHTLGSLGRAEYLELLKRLSEKCDAFSGRGDYEEAIVWLRDPAARDDWPPAWEEPVEEWLEPSCRVARDWFARRDAEAMDELNADPAEPRTLIKRFLKSAWATNLPEGLVEEAGYSSSNTPTHTKGPLRATWMSGCCAACSWMYSLAESPKNETSSRWWHRSSRRFWDGWGPRACWRTRRPLHRRCRVGPRRLSRRAWTPGTGGQPRE